MNTHDQDSTPSDLPSDVSPDTAAPKVRRKRSPATPVVEVATQPAAQFEAPTSDDVFKTKRTRRKVSDLAQADELGSSVEAPVAVVEAPATVVEVPAIQVPAANVRVAVESGEGTVRLVVEDDGPGVPIDLRGRVFEKYFRVEHVRAEHYEAHGAGIGLYLCRQVAEGHGGRVLCDASPSGGARFVLALPAPS